MKLKTAVECGLIWSGQFDIPGKFLTVTGVDAYGDPMSEQVPQLDNEKLDVAVAAKLAELRRQS